MRAKDIIKVFKRNCKKCSLLEREIKRKKIKIEHLENVNSENTDVVNEQYYEILRLNKNELYHKKETKLLNEILKRLKQMEKIDENNTSK